VIASQTARLLAFRIGPALAALPLTTVREVMEDPTILAVPGSHAHVAGIILSRSVAVPVYDLLRFDRIWSGPGPITQESGARRPQVIVCGIGEALIGLLVRDADLVSADEESGEMPPAGPIRPEFVRGRLGSGSAEVSILSPEKLFLSLGVPATGKAGAMEDGREKDPAGR
jgi:chemotaxis signal transduction protein